MYHKTTHSKLSWFFRDFGLGRLLALAGILSRTIGLPGSAIIQFLVGLICTERNLWQWFEEQSAAKEPLPFRKSTVYNLLKNPHMNWRRLLRDLSTATTRWVHRLSSRDGVLIFDDSLFGRQRSRKVDFLSKVYDHVEHRYRWGFRWLVMGWSDGTTFLPIDCALLGSRKPELRRQATPSTMDGRTDGRSQAPGRCGRVGPDDGFADASCRGGLGHPSALCPVRSVVYDAPPDWSNRGNHGTRGHRHGQSLIECLLRVSGPAVYPQTPLSGCPPRLETPHGLRTDCGATTHGQRADPGAVRLAARIRRPG